MFFYGLNVVSDFHIIGGGIIGMMTAKELVDAGAQITIIDRGAFAKESSWAGGGILSPLYPWRYPKPVNELAYQSQTIYSEYCMNLFENTGIDPEWTKNGLLIHDAAYDLPACQQWLELFPTDYELLTGEDIRQKEPEIALFSQQAIYLSEIAQVRNPRLSQALKSYLVQKGVEIKEYCEVKKIACSHSRIDQLITTGGNIEVKQLIVAGGAWSAQILKTVGLAIPIRPVKGQMVLFFDKKQRVRNIFLADSHYAIPRRDGHILIGSTMEETQFDKSTTVNGLKELKSFAVKWFPFMTELSVVQHWAGLRPGSTEGIPYIGQVPGIAGLSVNAGHFRNGVVTGPASARLLADILLKRVPQLAAEPFSLHEEQLISA